MENTDACWLQESSLWEKVRMLKRGCLVEQSLKKDGIKRSDEGFSLGRVVELVFLEQNVNKRNDITQRTQEMIQAVFQQVWKQTRVCLDF